MALKEATISSKTLMQTESDGFRTEMFQAETRESETPPGEKTL